MRQIPELPSLGKNLREQRLSKELSLEEVANASGVSKGMLSQIETEKANPTVATLWKIAHALDLDLASFLKGEQQRHRKFQVTRSQDISRLDVDADGVHINVLTSVESADLLELYVISFEPGASMTSAPHYDGAEEYLTVLDGQVRVSAASRAADLSADDFISYECDVTHSIENIAEGPSRVHLLVRFPG